MLRKSSFKLFSQFLEMVDSFWENVSGMKGCSSDFALSNKKKLVGVEVDKTV
jgi:hypothetical protein